MLAFASQLSSETGDPDGAVALAEQAVRLAEPNDPGAIEAEVRALLAAGHGAKANEAAARLLALNPLNQRFIALQAAAWRLIGDSRYGELFDYARFVKAAPISVPATWPTLEAYLADLALELKAAHPFKAQPFGHSVRLGSQKSDVLSVQTRAIGAFVEAISGPISAYLAQLGTGTDPFTSRNRESAQMIGNWSVWLRPGGHHADYVHPDGWISSACCIELPVWPLRAARRAGCDLANRDCRWGRDCAQNTGCVRNPACWPFFRPTCGMARKNSAGQIPA